MEIKIAHNNSNRCTSPRKTKNVTPFKALNFLIGLEGMCNRKSVYNNVIQGQPK